MSFEQPTRRENTSGLPPTTQPTETRPIVRMIVDAKPNADKPDVALCKRYNSSDTKGSTSIPVLVDPGTGVGDLIWAVMPYAKLNRRVGTTGGPDSGEHVVWIQLLSAMPTGVVRRCTVNLAGGDAGGDGVAPSLVYHITTLDGYMFPGAYPVEDRPLQTGEVIAGQKGTYCVDSDFVVHLITANEKFKTGPCGTGTTGGGGG